MNATSWAGVLLPMLLVACGPQRSAQRPMQAVAPSSSSPPPAAVATPEPTPAAAAAPKGKAATSADTTAVIYTGDVAMAEEPGRIPVLIDAIIDLSEAQGGRLQARRDDGVTIRVPAARFRETMTKIDRLGMVTHRSVTAEDVSEEIHDAEVRLLNLQATRKRLQDFLAKANDIPSTLTVEKELERVALEIDRIEGRMRFLQARASLSTIDVRIAAQVRPVVAAVEPPPPPAPRTGIALPITWLDQLDAAHLSNLH
jgi:hypothetical protein